MHWPRAQAGVRVSSLLDRYQWCRTQLAVDRPVRVADPEKYDPLD